MNLKWTSRTKHFVVQNFPPPKFLEASPQFSGGLLPKCNTSGVVFPLLNDLNINRKVIIPILSSSFSRCFAWSAEDLKQNLDQKRIYSLWIPVCCTHSDFRDFIFITQIFHSSPQSLSTLHSADLSTQKSPQNIQFLNLKFILHIFWKAEKTPCFS